MRANSGPREAQGPSKRPGDKTKFCMYFLQGVCKYGDDACPYAHSVEEMSRKKEMSSRNRGARRTRQAVPRGEDEAGGVLAYAPAPGEIFCGRLRGLGKSNVNSINNINASCPTWPDYTSYADCGALLVGAKAPPQRGRRIGSTNMATELNSGANYFNVNSFRDDSSRLAGAEHFNANSFGDDSYRLAGAERFNANSFGDDSSRLAGTESSNGSANGSRSKGSENFGACATAGYAAPPGVKTFDAYAHAGYLSGAMNDLGKVQQQTLPDAQESPDWPKLDEPMFIVTTNVNDPSYLNKGCLPAPGLTRPHSSLLTESNLQQHTIVAMMASAGRVDGCPWPRAS